MKKFEVTPFLPYISMERILAYESGRPETYTQSPVVNAVCEVMSDNQKLAAGHIAERMGLTQPQLANTLKVITGFTTAEIRIEVLAKRCREYMDAHPEANADQVAKYLGFYDYSSLWKFTHNNKSKFPKLFKDEEDTKKRMLKLTKEIMPREYDYIRKIYAQLPYRGPLAERDECLKLLYRHSRDVADLALEIAERHPELNLNLQEVEMAALLHDIGIVWTNAPGIHCYGTEQYIRHGEIGHEFMSRRSYIFAMVCQNHVGAGMTDQEIKAANLPLFGDHVPCTNLERLICYADKFFSKSHPERRKTMEEARRSLSKFGDGTMERFEDMVKQFGEVE